MSGGDAYHTAAEGGGGDATVDGAPHARRGGEDMRWLCGASSSRREMECLRMTGRVQSVSLSLLSPSGCAGGCVGRDGASRLQWRQTDREAEQRRCRCRRALQTANSTQSGWHDPRWNPQSSPSWEAVWKEQRVAWTMGCGMAGVAERCRGAAEESVQRHASTGETE